ncbi:MAG TPA: alkaline phosphatase family protein [Burkholderiaceae bacterium]
MGLENIKHVVVVMFENRSFDNLLGWLYDDATVPQHFIPADNARPFDGLHGGQYSNQLNPGAAPVNVSMHTTNWPGAPAQQVPSPDPHEEFEYVSQQLFGNVKPGPGVVPDMSGFLQNYGTVDDVTPETAAQIMETYSPGQAAVINDIAKNFAVCDAWFASVPSQTWPNRGFVHSGSSDGHINNENCELYDIDTIFNVLEQQGKSWGVFHDTTLIPSLTQFQFLPKLGDYPEKFKRFDQFTHLCAAAADAEDAQKLPAYSFVEPRFVPELGLFKIDFPADYHPPHNICRGEQFLASVYQSIRNSPYRDDILLVITFDEHGGCYDHVPPPEGAVAPLPGNQSRRTNGDGTPMFRFDRYGVRVPAIVVSSYVAPGTVFRAPNGSAPYDHCSILATLRDWLHIPDANFLASPRIAGAPGIGPVLTLGTLAKRDWPDINAACVVSESDTSTETQLSSVQHSLLAGSLVMNTATSTASAIGQAREATTYKDAFDFMHPDMAAG